MIDKDPNPLQIRKAEAPDLSQVETVDASAFGELCYPLFELREYLEQSGDFFFVAMIGTELAGYIIGTINTDNNRGWIESVVVLQKFRKKGIGNNLVKTVINTQKTRGITEVMLNVKPTNKSAIRLYTKLLFTKDKQEKNHSLTKASQLILIHRC